MRKMGTLLREATEMKTWGLDLLDSSTKQTSKQLAMWKDIVICTGRLGVANSLDWHSDTCRMQTDMLPQLPGELLFNSA